jgi:hypothetical protein
MPFVFIIIGIVMVAAGLQGNSMKLAGLVKNDLFGTPSFLYWFLAIMVIGALGYISAIRPLSRAFLVLVLIVLVLANDKNTSSGLIEKFQQSFDEIAAGKAS